MSHGPLLESLKAEAACLEQLLTQLRRQQAALVAGRSQEVQQVSQLADGLIHELQAASVRRQQAQTGFESLDQAAEDAPDLRTRTQLKATLAQLRQGSEELQKLGRRNSQLIEQGLGWVDATLASFVELQQQGQPALYGARGTEAASWKSERSIFDSNA